MLKVLFNSLFKCVEKDNHFFLILKVWVQNKREDSVKTISADSQALFVIRSPTTMVFPWWRHEMDTFSALLALCAGNSPVTGEFPSQRPVTRSFDVFFDLRLNKRLSKQPWG